jgi:hypothetical protein
MFTDLEYLFHNSHDIDNFMEYQVAEYQVVNWKNPQLKLYQKFKDNSLSSDDLGNLIDSDFCRFLTELDEKQYPAVMKFRENGGWQIGSGWIDYLFQKEEFVLQFNGSYQFHIGYCLEDFQLYDFNGVEIATYEY